MKQKSGAKNKGADFQQSLNLWKLTGVVLRDLLPTTIGRLPWTAPLLRSAWTSTMAMSTRATLSPVPTTSAVPVGINNMKNNIFKKEQMIVICPYELGEKEIFNTNLKIRLRERREGKLYIYLDYEEEDAKTTA